MKFIIYLMLFSSLTFLAGCQKASKKVIMISKPTLPHNVDGAGDRLQVDLITEMRKKGLLVFTAGQDHLISIPTNLLFANDSPRLLWHSYDLLYTVVCYLRQYRKIDVQVIAYTNKCASATRELALTRSRAREVANYLWQQGVKSRFVFSDGVGSAKPILADSGKGDKNANSRIEITFRDMVA